MIDLSKLVIVSNEELISSIRLDRISINKLEVVLHFINNMTDKSVDISFPYSLPDNKMINNQDLLMSIYSELLSSEYNLFTISELEKLITESFRSVMIDKTGN